MKPRTHSRDFLAYILTARYSYIMMCTTQWQNFDHNFKARDTLKWELLQTLIDQYLRVNCWLFYRSQCYNCSNNCISKTIHISAGCRFSFSWLEFFFLSFTKPSLHSKTWKSYSIFYSMCKFKRDKNNIRSVAIVFFKRLARYFHHSDFVYKAKSVKYSHKLFIIMIIVTNIWTIYINYVSEHQL